MKYTLLLGAIICLGFSNDAYSQLPDGATAPDFTVTDIFGNTHNLYDLLDAGKTVVLDFSATWCGPCWNYHNTHALKDFYEAHGPDATGESMVFFMESDMGTGLDDLYGLTFGTQGDWVTGTPYPIVNLTTPAVADDYDVAFFPTIYKICPDKKVYNVGQVGAQTLANWIQSCNFDIELDAVENTVCYGNQEGGASLLVTEGYGNTYYSWSNGSNEEMLDNVEAGVYHVTVSEGNGLAKVINNIIIDGPTEPLEVVQVFLEDVQCYGESSGSIAVEAVGGTWGYSYDWNTGVAGPDVFGLPVGTYTVTVTDFNGCSITESYEINEPSFFDSVISAEDDQCGQGVGTIYVDNAGGTPPYYAEWPGGAQPVDVLLELAGLTTGTYSITMTDANGCTNIVEETVLNVEGPEIVIQDYNPVTCFESVVTLEAIVIYDNPQFLTYAWSTVNGTFEGGTDGPLCSVTSGGTYILTVNDPSNGCSDFVEITVDEMLDGPGLVLSDIPAIDCNNHVVEVNVTSDNPVTTDFFWTALEGFPVESNGGTALIQVPGLYFVTGIDSESGCETSLAFEVLDEREYADAEFSITAQELEVQFSVISPVSNATYAWEFGDGQMSTEESPTHSYAIGGLYTVCLTVTNDCGEDVSCTQVVVNSGTAQIEVTADIIDISCYGASDGTITAFATGGSGNYTYTWTGPGGFMASGPTITGLGPGTYTVIVDDGEGNLFQQQFDVYQPDILLAEAEIVENNGDYQVTVYVTGGTPPYTYFWNNGITTDVFPDAPPGWYWCLVTDANGCEFFIDPIYIPRAVGPDIETDIDPGRVLTIAGNPNFQPIDVNVVYSRSSGSFSPTPESYEYAVVNLSGQMIEAGKFSGQMVQVDLRGNVPGMYFLVVHSTNGEHIGTEKLVLIE